MTDLKKLLTILTMATALSGCARPSSSPAPGADTTANATPVTFVNKVWMVSSSNAVAPGQLYVFLSEGTLVIASMTGTPSLGSWSQSGDLLTIVEEGISYPTEVLELGPRRFVVRMKNPGEPVEMTLVPAD